MGSKSDLSVFTFALQAYPEIPVLEIMPYHRGGHIQVLQTLQGDLAFSIPDMMSALNVKSGTTRMALSSNLPPGEYFKARSSHRAKVMGYVTSRGLIRILKTRLRHSRPIVRKAAEDLVDVLAPVFAEHLKYELADSESPFCPLFNSLVNDWVIVLTELPDRRRTQLKAQVDTRPESRARRQRAPARRSELIKLKRRELDSPVSDNVTFTPNGVSISFPPSSRVMKFKVELR